MDENNQEKNIKKLSIKEQLNTATPLSKYLAMALFITLPFIGLYIGYTYGKMDYPGNHRFSDRGGFNNECQMTEKSNPSDAEILIKYIVFRWPEDMPDLSKPEIKESEVKLIAEFIEKESLPSERVWPLVQLYLRDYGSKEELKEAQSF